MSSQSPLTDVYDGARKTPLSVAAGDVEVVTSTRDSAGDERFLLLHGNPGSMLDLARLFAPLGTMGEVAAYDAPGFGRSPTPAREEVLALESSAELALRMLDHLGWSRAVLIGHSHGGGVAQRVAERWPDRVRALVLLGTLGAPAHFSYRVLPLPGVETFLSLVGQVLPRLPERTKPTLVRYFMDLNYAPGRATPEEVVDEVALLNASPNVLRNMARVTRGNPCALLDARAPKITAPTLFLHGTKDAIVPMRYAKRIHERMQQAERQTRFVPVEDGSHMLAAQVPERCADAIRELLTSLPPV